MFPEPPLASAAMWRDKNRVIFPPCVHCPPLVLTAAVLQVLGTPTEDNWPGISRSEELAGYKFPAYGPESLVSKAPRLDSDGVGLLSSFLLFEAKKRLPAREALKHPYFSSFPQEVALLKDGKNDGNRLE